MDDDDVLIIGGLRRAGRIERTGDYCPAVDDEELVVKVVKVPVPSYIHPGGLEESIATPGAVLSFLHNSADHDSFKVLPDQGFGQGK